MNANQNEKEIEDPTREYFDELLRTKHGIDKTLLMLNIMRVVESKSGKQCGSAFDKLKSFICEQIKRGLSAQEDLNLRQGICNYINTDPQTNERSKAMEYLFEAKFIVE